MILSKMRVLGQKKGGGGRASNALPAHLLRVNYRLRIYCALLNIYKEIKSFFPQTQTHGYPGVTRAKEKKEKKIITKKAKFK